MKKKTILAVTKVLPLTLLLLTVQFSLNAQRVKDEALTYEYIQLPSEPVDQTIKNYQSEITQNFASENERLTEEYEAKMAEAKAKFDKEMEEYPALVQAAEDKYAAEMKEWDEKPLGDKIIEKQVLNENNKPVKRIPSEPRLDYVQPPTLQREYEGDALANTYLTLDGFTNDPANALKIEVIMYGFEYTNPRTVTEQKNILKDGNTTKVNYYHVEFTYRHTMAVKVTDPQGKELFFLTPVELNNYSKYATKESTTSQTANKEALVSMHEEKIIQENLLFIKNLVNDKIGFKHQPRTVNLSYVQENKGEYNDLLEAYNVTKSGLAMLIDNKTGAKEKLDQSIEMYEALISEADLNDKKARINSKVAIPIHFDLLECYFANDYLDKADNLLSSMNVISLDKKEAQLKEDFEKLLNDTKKRKEANL